MTKAQACAAHDGAVPSDVSRRPLCRRYVLGFFDIAVVRRRNADGLHDLPVHWAFGWLADGECEPLGVWIEPGAESAGPLRLLADLKTRGLERIRHVAGTDAGQLREHAAAAFSSAGGGSPIERIVTDASAASRRHVPASLERAAEDVREALARAIRRRGSFASEAAALDFISGALQRTERRLDRERAIAKVRPRHESGAQMVPPGF
ncbi:MAG: transposase [Pseudomonadota bacterium]|nr:transposase [Pseudomonadota bacterium]